MVNCKLPSHWTCPWEDTGRIGSHELVWSSFSTPWPVCNFPKNARLVQRLKISEYTSSWWHTKENNKKLWTKMYLVLHLSWTEPPDWYCDNTVPFRPPVLCIACSLFQFIAPIIALSLHTPRSHRLPVATAYWDDIFEIYMCVCVCV